MAHYQIRFRGPDGSDALIWDVDRKDDVAAMNSALDVCSNRTAEVWNGDRKVANISLVVESHLPP